MKATISLDGILAFLKSLSLSASNKEDFINRMCGAWRDDPRSTEQIIADIRGSRQFDVTRHIMPLTDEKE